MFFLRYSRLSIWNLLVLNDFPCRFVGLGNFMAEEFIPHRLVQLIGLLSSENSGKFIAWITSHAKCLEIFSSAISWRNGSYFTRRPWWGVMPFWSFWGVTWCHYNSPHYNIFQNLRTFTMPWMNLMAPLHPPEDPNVSAVVHRDRPWLLALSV